MAPEVIFERTTVIALARVGVVRWKALGTPVLSAAGRCVVVQVAAHGRCVLVCAVRSTPALTMEIEPHTGTFKSSESMITVRNNLISSQFYLRNYDKEQNRVIKKFLNTQHWDSYNN